MAKEQCTAKDIGGNLGGACACSSCAAIADRADAAQREIADRADAAEREIREAIRRRSRRMMEPMAEATVRAESEVRARLSPTVLVSARSSRCFVVPRAR
jgi:hypothetical protein